MDSGHPSKVAFHCPVRPVQPSSSKWNAGVLRTSSGRHSPAHGSELCSSPAPVGQSAGLRRVLAGETYARDLDWLFSAVSTGQIESYPSCWSWMVLFSGREVEGRDHKRSRNVSKERRTKPRRHQTVVRGSPTEVAETVRDGVQEGESALCHTLSYGRGNSICRPV